MIKDLLKLADSFLGVILINEVRENLKDNTWTPNDNKKYRREIEGIIAFTKWSILENRAFEHCGELKFIIGVSPILGPDMNNMFSGASSFNQPLNSWDVSSVTDMSAMFYGASDFNQPLNSWDVSNVTNMSYMFCNASSFNQQLNSWGCYKY